MGGVNGVISSKVAHLEHVVKQMNNRLAHRGFGGQRVLAENGVALGDLDSQLADGQLLTSGCGRFVLVLDGELYNMQDLAREVGCDCSAGNGGEVLLAAWARYGSKCVEMLKGAFAFAIWDKKSRLLSLVRDQMGVKPLYWCLNDEGLIFSSEIRGVLASGLVSSDLSAIGLVDYLRYQTVQSPDTILRDVKMLPPAYVLKYEVDNKCVTVERYWDIRPSDVVFKGSYDEVKSVVSKLFYRAVERSLTTEKPLGAFLSGGVDSSAVVGAAARLSLQKVKTFNISFAEEKFSEAQYARHVAQIHNTEHHEIKLTPNDFLEMLPSALASMDHPSGDGPNTWVVSKLTKAAGVDVALSGLGGDELFGGYAIFKRMATLDRMKWLWRLPVALRKGAGAFLKAARPGVASSKMVSLLGLRDYQFNQIYSVSRQVLLDNQISELLNGSTLSEHLPVKWLGKMLWDSDLSGHLLSRVSVAEMSTYMQNVLLRDSDQMGMAHTLELRVPFMDVELIEYVLSLPDAMKYPITPKKLLVDSLPDLLPDYIVNRPKMGFVFPWDEWLKNELHSFVDSRIDDLTQWETFNSEAVLSLWKRFKKGDPEVTFSRIWALVVLAEWRRNSVGL